MSECVVRMEMPQNCCHCPMIAYADKIKWVDNGRETEGAYICLFTKELIDNTKRADDCPIICSLPEGHGRLVDADAAVNDIRYEILEYKMDGLKGTPIPTDHLWLMKNWIADEDICPTIVPAEAERSET